MVDGSLRSPSRSRHQQTDIRYGGASCIWAGSQRHGLDDRCRHAVATDEAFKDVETLGCEDVDATVLEKIAMGA